MSVLVSISALSGEGVETEHKPFATARDAVSLILEHVPPSRYIITNGKKEQAPTPPATFSLIIDGVEQRIQYFDDKGERRSVDDILSGLGEAPSDLTQLLSSPVDYDPAELADAQAAIERIEARPAETPEEWASRLGADLARFND